MNSLSQYGLPSEVMAKTKKKIIEGLTSTPLYTQAQVSFIACEPKCGNMRKKQVSSNVIFSLVEG